MRVYIAGPMTGHTDWNYPAFFAAEERLRELGHDPINPARNDGATLEQALAVAGTPARPNYPWAHYMRRDLPNVMEAEALCVLPGWQNSKGARLEVTVATALGLPLLTLIKLYPEGRQHLVPRVRALGISGYARSGKDTVGEFLVKTHGYTRAAFADPMREALTRLNPTIDIDAYYGHLADALQFMSWDELKGHSQEVRPLLQRLGTEVGRDMFGKDFWVDLAINRLPDGAKVVFTDVRFTNEADAIRALGGQVWRINRPGVDAANSHSSEVSMDGYAFDQIIDNAGSLTNLYQQVEVLL